MLLLDLIKFEKKIELNHDSYLEEKGKLFLLERQWIIVSSKVRERKHV